MAIREYTLGPREKTRVFYASEDEPLSKFVKHIRKWIKQAEEDFVYPYELSVHMDDEGYVGMVRYSE